MWSTNVMIEGMASGRNVNKLLNLQYTFLKTNIRVLLIPWLVVPMMIDVSFKHKKVLNCLSVIKKCFLFLLLRNWIRQNQSYITIFYWFFSVPDKMISGHISSSCILHGISRHISYSCILHGIFKPVIQHRGLASQSYYRERVVVTGLGGLSFNTRIGS